jgi:hypothetical protein
MHCVEKNHLALLERDLALSPAQSRLSLCGDVDLAISISKPRGPVSSVPSVTRVAYARCEGATESSGCRGDNL